MFIIIRNSFIALTLIASLSGCVMSGYNLSEGITAFKVQNYRQAFVRLMPEARRGQPDAQYAIGYMYYYGQGVTEDRKQALYWIRCAAKAGQSDARKALKLLDHSAK